MKIVYLIGIAAAALSTGAGAQDRPARPDLTRAQAIAQADKLFEVMDRNKDSQLTREEVQLAMDALRVEREKRMQERMAQMTPEQRARMEQRRAEWAKRRAEGAGAAGGEARRGGGMMGLDRLLGDKPSVTKAEFLQQMTDRFDRSDANRDGTITADEQQQRRGDRRQRAEEAVSADDEE